jgi:glucose/arabinose dehydrogenase
MRAALGAAVLVLLALAPAATAAPRLVPIGSFAQPTYVTAPPGDVNRLFVTERAGRVRVIDGGSTRAAPFLDLTAITESGYQEQGLLSIAFPPDYAAGGRFYVYLTVTQAASVSGTAGEIQIREYRRSAADPDVADPNSGRVLVAIRHDANRNHNGGQLQFGPDGKLWAGTGDGGGANDPAGNAQNPASRLGKLLRIDPVQTPPTVETVALGLRNPWRFSFDYLPGELVIADVGQAAVEEVDVAPAPGYGVGANFGWPCLEGTRVNTAHPCSAPGAVPPRLERPHSATVCSITGGYVVRDPGLPTLLGRYVYGDFCGDSVRSVDLAQPSGDRAEALPIAALSSFGEDACGRILAVSLDGPVYRLVDGAPSACAFSPAGGPVPGAPAHVDKRPCKLAVHVSGGRSFARRHRLRLTLRADEACRAVVGGRVRGVAGLRRVKRSLAAGRRAVITLRLGRRGVRRLRRALRRHRSLVVALRVRTIDAAGNRGTVTRRLRIHRR